VASAARPSWEAELTRLVAERGDALARYAYLLCGDRDEAADLVQSGLVATYGRLRNGFTIDRAEAYVRRAISSAFIDSRRRSTRWRATAHLHLAPESVDGPTGSTDSRLDLKAELRALSPRERACVVLRYYGDRTVADIAAELGISDGAVKRYLSDGLAKLGRAVADRREEPRGQLR
jgi:RNA polymerase sigma factor (sigma-70 family)